MNTANLKIAKTEIIKRIGYFPAFLIPALNSSSIYSSLVKQTLSSYINNPLPVLFKEKLAVAIAYYYDIDYFTICHSCTLHSLGVTPQEILALGKIKFPQTAESAIAELELLGDRLRQEDWHNPQVEAVLLRCAGFIFSELPSSTDLYSQLKSLLGTFHYHYLVVFLDYIKLCHEWVIANPTISHQKDRRSQMYLGSLLLEDIELAKFFQRKRWQDSSSIDTPKTSSNFLSEGLNQSCAICLENDPFPVMIRDRQDRILCVNQNWLEVTGYTSAQIPTIEEWKQKAITEQREVDQLSLELQSLGSSASTSAVDLVQETTTKLQQIVNCLAEFDLAIANKTNNQTNEAAKSVITIVTREGKQRWWQLYSMPMSNAYGDRLTVSIAKDVTDLINYQARLSEIESRLELVSQATPIGYWSWNLTTNRVAICDRGCAIAGLENFDGSYISFLGSIHPDERESVDLAIAKAIQGRQDFDLKYRIVKSARETVLIRNFGRLEYNTQGQPVSISGIVTNITDNRSDRDSIALDKYKISKNLFNNNYLITSNILQSPTLQTIFDLLPYYIFVVDLETQTISAINSNMARSLALEDPEAAKGKTIAECFTPEYADRIAEQHQQIATDWQVLRIEQKVILRDGIHYWDTTITPIRDDNGIVYALLHTSNEVRNLTNTEEAVSRRSIQLEAANRELESFSYSVSHDLQAPLRIINGFSQILWEQYQLDLDDRGKHYLERIQANSQRMSGLIDALLQLSRVTRSQMKAVNVNLSAIALDIVEELRLANPERVVEVIIAPDIRVQGDPQLLRIVLNNLFNNAWKYTSKRTDGKIEFGSFSPPNQLTTYYVRDNGAGFDPEYTDKLFTAFQRLHSPIEFPGTGIGLATVRRIIYRHGGRVWAEGECDRGATIYFSL